MWRYPGSYLPYISIFLIWPFLMRYTQQLDIVGLQITRPQPICTVVSYNSCKGQEPRYDITFQFRRKKAVNCVQLITLELESHVQDAKCCKYLKAEWTELHKYYTVEFHAIGNHGVSSPLVLECQYIFESGSYLQRSERGQTRWIFDFQKDLYVFDIELLWNFRSVVPPERS